MGFRALVDPTLKACGTWVPPPGRGARGEALYLTRSCVTAKPCRDAVHVLINSYNGPIPVSHSVEQTKIIPEGEMAPSLPASPPSSRPATPPPEPAVEPSTAPVVEPSTAEPPLADPLATAPSAAAPLVPPSPATYSPLAEMPDLDILPDDAARIVALQQFIDTLVAELQRLSAARDDRVERGGDPPWLSRLATWP